MRVRSRFPIRRLSVVLHRAVGACLFHAGAHEYARRHFERILEVEGDDFGAYVHLALVAYRLGDYGSWQRECGHARRTDPLRYSRLRHPFELFEGRGATTGPEPGPRWRRAFRVSHVGSGRATGIDAGEPAEDRLDADVRGVPTGRSTRADATAMSSAGRRAGHDDCASEAERRRLAQLGPIARAEVLATDLDELARRLGG